MNHLNSFKLLLSLCSNYVECEEFKMKVTEENISTGFSLESQTQTLSQVKCNQTSGFIVGGSVTAAGEFPHMAALLLKSIDGNFKFFCGGSLISEKFVLTAAHCKRPT